MSLKTKLTGWRKALYVTGNVFGSIIVTVFTIIALLNVIKFAVYTEYYSIREIVCTNNGLRDNYVSQGTAITDDGKYIITSGYMSDKTDSRIYITEIATDKAHPVKVLRSDGKVNKSHFGGVAVNGDTIYLAGDNSIHTVSLSEALEKDEVVMEFLFESETEASYVFCSPEHIYVGEFHDGNDYVTDTEIIYNGVTYHAMFEQYTYGNYDKPIAVYALRNKVQGLAFDDKGNALISASYGLDSSDFYFYRKESIVDAQTTYNDCPLYVLEKFDKRLVGPAMGEDLDFLNGKFYTNFESACNKYVYGKFFTNADKIVALDFSRYSK